MTNRTLAGAGVLALAIGAASALPRAQFPSGLPSCRHGGSPTDEDSARRQQATALARRINAAQASFVRETGRFAPVERLGRLPAVPAGFALSMYVDGNGYLFAIKDTRDPCRFAIFSDEAGLLYETSGLDAPIVASPR
jgi:hypothetical protein